MTVTPKGEFLISDPGVGILAPGWHGWQPGSEGDGGDVSDSGEEEEDEGRCDILILGAIAAEKSEMLNFATSIRAEEGGTWRWEATGGVPATGIGPEFDVQFPEDGTKVITVNYVSADGEQQCLDGHVVEVGPAECEVGIRGPVEFPVGRRQTFIADVSQEGERFQWSAEGDPNVFSTTTSRNSSPGGSGQAPTQFRLPLPSGKMEGSNPAKMKSQFFVNDELQILLLSTAHEFLTATVFKSIKRSDSRRTKALPVDGSPGQARTRIRRLITRRSTTSCLILLARKTSPLRYEPFNGDAAQTSSVSINVKDICKLTIAMVSGDFNPPLNTDYTVRAVFSPPGGTVSWRAPGGAPSSGSGEIFTVRYSEEGPRRITAVYEAPNGEHM